MIPVKLELRNFLPYSNPAPLDFTGIHVACLAGDNGAGKSSLLDAMTWALWGKARDGKRSDDELIHHERDEMHVEFTFDVGSDRYKILRQRKAGKRGQSVLDLQTFDTATESWRSLSASGVRATQGRINNLLRIEYETFVNSAFILQGRADAFTVKPPGERKAVLADILGLDQWVEYERRAKKRIVTLREEILVIDHEIQTLAAELDRRAEYEAELAEAEKKQTAIEAQLAAAMQEMAGVDQARQSLALARKRIDDLNARIARDTHELTEIEKELARVRAKGDAATLAAETEAVRQRLEQLQQKETEHAAVSKARSIAAEERARVQGENATLLEASDPLKQRIETLAAAAEPICPTCGQPLADHLRAALTHELQADLDSSRARWKENNARYKELTQQVAEMDRTLAELAAGLKEQNTLQRKLASLEATAASAVEAQATLAALTARREHWNQSITTDRSELQAAQKQAQGFELQLQEADERQAAVDKLQFEQRMATEQVGSARQKLSALENLEKRRATKLAERQARAETQGVFEELRTAFGKQGVPAMIIEAAVPEIEETANALLARMTGGRMHVKFDTQVQTRAGEMRETLDINISDELGTRAYELFSGGESFRVNFAIRIALSKLLARRAGAQLQTIVIDEGFGTQDTEGRERLIEAINSIQDDFERVLVITHIEELKDAFPTRINVVKTSEGSQFWIE